MVIMRIFLLITLSMLGSCATYQPTQINDVCKIFWGETDWYEDARDVKKRWGVSISVMMAIMRQESSFRPNVRPERPKFLFIPLPRKSSAYGYAQAQDPAWEDYRKATETGVMIEMTLVMPLTLLAGMWIRVTDD